MSPRTPTTTAEDSNMWPTRSTIPTDSCSMGLAETLRPSLPTTPQSQTFSACSASRLPMGQTNWLKYDSFGRLKEAYDFKGQHRLIRYDHLGRVTTNFWFATGAAYPSDSTEYRYDHLGRLTNITERSGTDASNTYVAW